MINLWNVMKNVDVLIIDDIVATGGTVLAVKDLMKQLKAKANHLLVLGVLLDECPTGPKKIEKAGIKVHYVINL